MQLVNQRGCWQQHLVITPTTKQLFRFLLKIRNFNPGCEDGIVRVYSGHWCSNLCSKSVQFCCLYSRIDSSDNFFGNFKLWNKDLTKQTNFNYYWWCGRPKHFLHSSWLCLQRDMFYKFNHKSLTTWNKQWASPGKWIQFVVISL